MFQQFPYTNFHELNLDWIIKIAKDFLDQYTHIQDLITNGETSITNLTNQGLTDLQTLADRLQSQLDTWYNTHSADIANQLADSLTQIQSTLTATVNSFRSQANAIAAEVIDSIPEDYTALANTVAQLQEMLTWAGYKYGYYAIDRGAIRATNGADINTPEQANNRARTDLLPRSISAVKTTGNYEFLVFAYDAETGAYVGALDANGNWIQTTTGLQYVTYYAFTDKQYRYRIVFKLTDGSDFATYAIAPYLYWYCNVDTSLTKYGYPADSGFTGSRINDLSITRPEYITKFYIDEFSDFSQGAINNAGQVIIEGFERAICSPAYPAIENDIVEAHSEQVRELNAQYICIAFYDSNNTFISRKLSTVNTAGTQATAPRNTAFYRVSVTQVLTNGIRNFYIHQKIVNPFIYNQHTTIPKMYVFGDSITAGYYSLTDAQAAAEGVTIVYRPGSIEGVGSAWDRTLAHNYLGYANKTLQFNITNLAYPAQGYIHEDSQDNTGIKLVNNTDLSDADIILFALGFNDWHYKMMRGDHTPPEAYPVNTLYTDITTINQAIWWAIGKAIQKAPNATIIVATPLNGWLYGGDFSTNWGMGYTLARSGKLGDIVDDIKYWCSYYGVQLLDLASAAIINRLNIQDTEIDGSHPTNAAHKQLGRYVASAIKYL